MKIKIFAIALLLASIVYGQVDTPFDKKHITDSKQLKHALKNIKEGNKLFDLGKGRYIDALGYFLEANKINANNADLNYKIGICYLFTTDIELGLEHLNKAKRLNPQVNHELSYYLGRAYHLNHQFDTAIVYYNEFKLNLYKRELKIRAFEIDKLINECENGKELVKKSEKLLIDNLGPNINTIYPEYAPIIIANEEVMFFTSRRPTTTGGKRDPIDKIYYEDIYMATKDNDNNWQQMPVTELNTNKHDAVVGYFKGKELSYLYTYKNKHGGDIYISLIKNNKIDIPKPLPFPINTKYHESSASLSPDSSTLYFISDRPGGVGGRDIWVAYKDSKGRWKEVRNIRELNTPYDEEAVFIHPDGRTLYFSSKGHNTMGGYDIFKSTYKDGYWSKPENLGVPINTADDDLYFVLASSGQRAYFSSSRKGTLGDQDIFMITFIIDKPMNPSSEDNLIAHKTKPVQEIIIETTIEIETPSLTLLKGRILDEETKKPLEAQIILTDNEKNEELAVFTSNAETGKYLVSLPSGKNYGIAVKKDGYLFHSENFIIPENAVYQEIQKDIYLKPIKIGQSIVLRNIFFDFDKATLRPESKTELDNLIKLMNDNPNIKIEISGHTDNIGSAAYNQKLSEARAKAVVDYLVEHGIDRSRLSYIGYGFEKPIATNDTEEGRQLNRRVEFKIIQVN
jgi:outer membrane protein OmpA-like peptidoglycan-associated protein